MFAHEPDYQVSFFGATARWQGGGWIRGTAMVLAALAMGLGITAGFAWLVTWAVNDIIDNGITFWPVLAIMCTAHYLVGQRQ